MKKIILMLIIATSFNANAAEIDLIYRYEINVEYFGNVELVSIFTRKITRWETGERIRVYIKPYNSFEHTTFTSIILGMTSYRYKQMLEKRVYNGGISPPLVMNTDELMIEAVTNTEYSIGYLNYGTAILNIGGRNIKIVNLP